MFYVGYDDAEDLYTDGRLKESFPGPADSLRDYRYGYGHGFSPFNEIIRTLDLHRTDSMSFCSEMADKEAMNILSRVAQDYMIKTKKHPSHSTARSITARRKR